MKCVSLPKDLVRIKKAVEKFEIAKANLSQIQIQLMTASGQELSLVL